jgi:hypothetical protein
METKRRFARKQPLPISEISLLSSLTEDSLYTRIRDLYNEGWTLQSIGNAFNPPRPRSTVRSWVLREHNYEPLLAPIVKPKIKTQPKGYVSRRPKSPGITPDQLARIKELSPLARRYRSGMLDNAPVAIANTELGQICLDLYAKNVTVRELAAAAGVTYRAMARRLGK